MTKIFLNYWKAKDYAEKNNLKECSYGESDENVSYCAWNKSGDDLDEWEVEAYYKFEPEEVEKNGHKYTKYVPEKETSVGLFNWAKLTLGTPFEEILGVDDDDKYEIMSNCDHENIEWGDDDERGKCLDCGAECDWHWVKGVNDNYPESIQEIEEREILEWHYDL